MRRGRDRSDQSGEHDEPDPRDGADWLLGELAAADERADEPNVADRAAGAPAGRADGGHAAEMPAPAASAPWTSRRERRDETADWFSLAEPRPAAPQEPADAPAPASEARASGLLPAEHPSGLGDANAPDQRARDDAPARDEGSAPGPVTPTAPFALTWGAGAAETEAPPAPFTPPRVARRSFTPPADDGAPAPASAPDAPGASDAAASTGRPAAPVDDYGAALWSALTEPESPAAAGGDEPAASVDADVPEPGRRRPPFPAFASARWGEPAAERPAAEPVDDLLAAPGAVTADGDPEVARARRAGVDPARRPEPDAEVSARASADDGLDESLADTGAQPGFVWNLTPDPTAADPSVSEARRRRSTHPEAVPPEPAVAEPADAEAAPSATNASPQRDAGPGASDEALTAAFGGIADDADPWRAASAGVGSAALGASLAATPPEAQTGTAVPAVPASAPADGAATAPSRAVREASASRGGGTSGGGARPPAPPRGDGRRTTRLLLWIAGGLVVALVLAGLYFLGTQLAGGGDETPAASPSPSAEPTPEAAPEPTAPQPAGVHAWDTLFGGECLEPFSGAWAEEFTVVDCAAPHAAQLVYRGLLADDAAAPFPGEAELASRMNLLCTAPGVIDVAAATGVNDLQVQGAYPVTEEQWAEGERTYYCFVNRAGGEPLTGSLQGSGPTA